MVPGAFMILFMDRCSRGLTPGPGMGFLFSRGDDYQNQSGSETICVLYIHCIILYNIYVYNMYSINSI